MILVITAIVSIVVFVLGYGVGYNDGKNVHIHTILDKVSKSDLYNQYQKEAVIKIVKREL